jgi:transglutaminase-like putative cysteine protease
MLLLLLVTMVFLPAAAIEAEWVPGDEGLLPFALIALLVGRWLALDRDWGWDVWLLVGLLLGVLASLSVAARAVFFLPGGGEAAFDFVQRWIVWLEAAFTGGTSEDPDVFLFYAALLCWGAALLTAWAFYRRQRPLLALLPPVTLAALSVFYSERGVLWLVGELACGVLLLAVGRLAHAQRVWDAKGVDYAADLGIDITAVAVLIAIPVGLLSLFGPQFSARRVSDWFWRTFEEPSARVDETAERLFGGVSPPEGGPPSGGVGTGVGSYLPQTHLLGGRPDLLDTVVMMVWTDEPPPPYEDIPHGYYEYEYEAPRHYWQGANFDHYSGRGWVTTTDFREEVEGELPLPTPPAYREVEQRFEFVAPHGDTLYALSAPSWVGQPVEAVWRLPDAPAGEDEERGPGEDERSDLARLVSEVVSYTVVSRLPTPTASDLEAVPPLYSDEIRERYLQLPDTVPQRVRDLAQEVVIGGNTVYERARLLERYLRSYPYSLEIEEPPEDRDVADYFLFGVREGYCDYYATAFVVMARAVGIPARLASGYVGGLYDYGSGAYLVRHGNGHSWPEVYFPGWGWIGFEPTGSQPVTELPEEVVVRDDALPTPTGPPARVVRSRWRRVGLVGAALTGVGVLLVTWLRRLRRRANRPITLALVWGWVGRGGARLGLPQDPALTSGEYAATLAAELHRRAARARRWPGRWTRLAARGGMMLESLAGLYSERVYGRPQAVMGEEQVARGMWRRLRIPLRWFRWLGWMQRIARMD